MARWSETEKSDIKARFLKGETATQIATVYVPTHPDVSRNAILGVLHRAGVLGQGRARLQSQPTAKQRARLQKARQVRPAVVEPVGEGPVAFLAPVVVDSRTDSTFARQPGERREGSALPIRPVGPNAAPLLQLGPRRCKFPVGEPEPGEDRLFCGEATVAEAVYCVECQGRAYQPSAPRSSERDLLRIARRAS